ncbi:hypothetical protein C823_000641 [Eubacterium plexicaudatum ASF492]|nr:hypothetical protein C823_000641 [Eubacterium plexicaudatum ASF492]
MKKLFKKNQIIITALALMIAAAGYLSYTHSSIGDEGLTQTSAELTEEDYDIVYDETLVDADIFTETEVDTKLDDTTADTKTDDADAKKKNKKDNADGSQTEKRLTVRMLRQPAAMRQPRTANRRIARSAIREKPFLRVRAYRM